MGVGFCFFLREVCFFGRRICDDGIYWYGSTCICICMYIDSCKIVAILVVCISLKGMEVKTNHAILCDLFFSLYEDIWL